MVLILTLCFAGSPLLNAKPIESSSYGKATVKFHEAESSSLFDEYALGDDLDWGIPTPADDDVVSVIVKLKGESLMDFAYGKKMSVAEAVGTESGRQLLQQMDRNLNRAENDLGKYILSYGYRYSTIFNGFSANIRYGDIGKLKSSDAVSAVILGNRYTVPEAVTENDVQVYSTGIYDSSSVNYDGTGTVVAILDTGTDYTHEVFDMELDASFLALTKDDVTNLLPLLTATAISAAKDEVINADDLYLTSKLPFAYDYADQDVDVYPAESHGTHVAGIVAGQSDKITGVATGAQIATFKVFSDYNEGAPSEAILAALNDAVTLGVDVINMSLGSSCGFSREEDDDEINRIYDSINDAGICLIVAASNSYSSAFGSKWGNTNLASNPDSGTIGSPASYDASLAVASISGVKTKYFIPDGGSEVYFAESRLMGKTKPNDFVAGLLGTKTEGDFEYRVIPGVGLSVNYTGIDVQGKIAVVRRGNTSFEDKVRVAYSKGAIGVIVYNNVSGTISMSVGTKELIPSCFVTREYAQAMVAKGSGTIHLSTSYLAGPFMSDFSSWGVLPNLTLSPDITAHGGEIYSAVVGGNRYDTYSGTSMASPNLAGAAVLVRQFVREMHPEYNTVQVRDETYSRLMSTATMALNEEGNPYSPRKQGAGLADIFNSVNTKAYITVDGSNKPKLSLGDDPSRAGVYTLTFNVINTSGDALSYRINPYVMTESMSSDERTVAEKAYLFNDTNNVYSVNAVQGVAKINGQYLTISGYGQAQVTVKITLSSADKQYLNSNFRNGMYVEGYVRLESANTDGIDLGIPYLTFYGNWADAPMLDVSAYEVGASAVDDSVLAEDKLTADVHGTLPFAGFSSSSSKNGIAYWGMGQFSYLVASGYAEPVPQEKYASLTTNKHGNYLFYMVSAGLLRCAKVVNMEIRDSSTGELIWSDTKYNSRKSYSQGGDQVGGYVPVEVDISQLKLANNSRYTFNMECFLDWKDANGNYTYGNNNTFSFEFAIDDENPELEDVAIREVKSGTITRHYIDITIYDNHYLQGMSLITYKGASLNSAIEYTRLADGVIPIDSQFNASTTVSMDISGYWDKIVSNNGQIYLAVYDYAKNESTYTISISQEDDVHVETTRTAPSSFTLAINGQRNLKDYISVKTNVLNGEDKVYLENYWYKALNWFSSDPSVVEVRDGLVTGLKTGTATVYVCAPLYHSDNLIPEDRNVFWTSFTINVTSEQTSIVPTGIEMSTTSMYLERGETATITAKIEPYNYNQPYNLVWSSTSQNVVIKNVSGDGLTATIYATQSGSATVWVQLANTRISGSCSVYVQNEYLLYSNIYLRSYIGRGDENGVVDIPSDLGVSYIYPQAFAGNEYIKKVIIPEGVTIIMEQAFAWCSNLEEVVLPESVETIEMGVFANCPKLKKINLGNVRLIRELAFYDCTSLSEVDLHSCTFIDSLAFVYSGLIKLDLTGVGAVGGGAFAGCEYLSEVVIPAHTTLRYDPTCNGTTSSGAIAYMGGAFAYCTSLTKVTVYSDNVGAYAFFGCTALRSVDFLSDINTIGECAFANCRRLSSVNFAKSVYKIDDCAFLNCALTSFKLPKGLTVVGTEILYYNSIRNIDVSKDAILTDVAYGAFYGCGVQNFNVEEGSKYLTSQNGVLYDKLMKKLISYPYTKASSSFTLPDSVRTIGSAAFAYVEMLRTVNLNNVEYIEDMAFIFSQVTTINGYDNVIYIGEAAFYEAPLTSLPIGDNLVYIGNYAFFGTRSLSENNRTLVIPASVEHIGDYAFEYTNLTSVSFEDATITEVGVGAFAVNTQLLTVNFGSLTKISEQMFAGCSQLASVVIPDTITEVGRRAFEDCSSLRSVTLPDGITSIATSAFSGTALTEVTLPASVKTIGDYAFYKTQLASINLDNVTTIGDYAFAETSLVEVESASVKAVGNNAFARNTHLQSVALPNAESVGDNAFANCSALSQVQLDNAKYVGSTAFADCGSLQSIELDKAVSIGNQAFRGATALSSVSLDSVETLGAEVFSGTAITEIDLPNTLAKVAERAFYGAQQLVAINVESNCSSYISVNGVLYAVNGKGEYILYSYPHAKTDTSYEVLNGTIKLAAHAFNGNNSLTNVTLPVHLQVIGASVFEGVTNLTQIKLNAIAAPTLESVMVGNANVYNNFNFTYGQSNGNLTIIIPNNNSGYNNHVWSGYVGNNIQVSNEAHIGISTLDFINRVKAVVVSKDKAEIASLKMMYNLFNTVQKLFINGTYQAPANANYTIDAAYYQQLLGGRNYYNELLNIKA